MDEHDTEIYLAKYYICINAALTIRTLNTEHLSLDQLRHLACDFCSISFSMADPLIQFHYRNLLNESSSRQTTNGKTYFHQHFYFHPTQGTSTCSET